MVRKPHRGRLRIALCYPNTYRVAMGNLGFHQIYHLFNLHDDVVCERATFEPGGGKPVTIESGAPISSFDVIAFSISYETDLVNLARMLHRAGVPLDPGRRAEAGAPLVLVGGVLAFLNPEPLAPFADLVAMGEGEVLVPSFVSVWREHGTRPRTDLLLAMAAAAGLYAPSQYGVDYDDEGRERERRPLFAGAPDRVERIFCRDLSADPARTRVFSEGTEFGDMALVELSRGCVHACRFCAAAYIYRPPRWVGAESVAGSLARGFEVRERAGLISASVTDHPEFERIRAWIRDQGKVHSVASLRLDEISPELLADVRACGHKTLTLAPEAATDRLRSVINKPFDNALISRAAEMVGASGLPGLKLYFQVGLPEETDEDVEGLVPLTAMIKAFLARGSGKKNWPGKLTVAVNPFVPKPGTPFQWRAMAGPEELERKLALLKGSLGRLGGVRLQTGSIREAMFQAAVARGDRRTGALIAEAAREGLNPLTGLKRGGGGVPGLSRVLHRVRGEDEIFPWDFLEHRVSKSVLWKENERARAGLLTARCRPGAGCGRCEACK